MDARGLPPRVELAAPAWVSEAMAIGLVVTDATGSAHFANPAWMELTGQGDLAWREHGWLRVVDATERPGREREILERTRTGGRYSSVWTVDLGTSDRPEATHLAVTAVARMVDGVAVDIAITAVDLTTERSRSDELLFRATHDELTGLYNRAQFAMFVERALTRRVRDPTPVAAVLFLDVDDLKGTNDRFGHHAGDRVLTTVAQRIVDAVRPGDIVARYGGDEFAVLCEDLHDEGEISVIADRIRERVHAAYADDGTCSVSIGVAPARRHHLVADLMRDADQAMYREKHSHRHLRLAHGTQSSGL